MRRNVVFGFVSVFALAAALGAQGGGGFGEGNEAGGVLRPLTRFEQFAGKLKLDRETQTAAASAMLQEGAAEAGPVGGQMIQLQQKLVNAWLLDQTEAEIQALRDEYQQAAARMTGLEAQTFARIYAMLRENQQGGAEEAFDLMAGWLQPAAPGAGGQGPGMPGSGGYRVGRLELLANGFDLTGDQQRAVKVLMDDASESAAPIREGLAETRPHIVEALEGGAAQSEIDAAVAAYAAQATAMAALEMKALAGLFETLTPEQREDMGALRAAFLLARGAFVEKNWNAAPNPDKSY